MNIVIFYCCIDLFNDSFRIELRAAKKDEYSDVILKKNCHLVVKELTFMTVT